MLKFADPMQILTAVQTFCCAWYGSCLWNLYGEGAGKVFRSWNTTVKIAYDLPRQLFSVKKATIPEDGLQTIELLDYLLFIRRQETATCDTDVILEDLEQTIVQTCTS